MYNTQLELLKVDTHWKGDRILTHQSYSQAPHICSDIIVWIHRVGWVYTLRLKKHSTAINVETMTDCVNHKFGKLLQSRYFP